jgi:hypothetical protein
MVADAAAVVVAAALCWSIPPLVHSEGRVHELTQVQTLQFRFALKLEAALQQPLHSRHIERVACSGTGRASIGNSRASVHSITLQAANFEMPIDSLAGNVDYH